MGYGFATSFALAIIVLPYIAPILIALHRDHRQKGPIIIICLFTGWTGIGWLVALAWSFSGQQERPEASRESDQAP